MRSFFLILAVLLTGCDCLHRVQFQITRPSDAAAFGADRAMLRDVISQSASAEKLQDGTRRSVLPDTIAYYREAVPIDNPRVLVVGAREVDGQLVADVNLWNPGCDGGRKGRYERLVKRLRAALATAFPGRIVETNRPGEMVGYRDHTAELKSGAPPLAPAPAGSTETPL